MAATTIGSSAMHEVTTARFRPLRVATVLWVVWAAGWFAAAEQVRTVQLVTVVVMVAAWLVLEVRTSALTLAVFTALSVAAVAVSAPELISDLSHPDSLVGFGLALMPPLAAALAVVAVLAAWKDLPAPIPTIALFTAGAVFLAAGLASLLISLDVKDEAPHADDRVFLANRIAFAPSQATFSGPTGVYIENRDPFHHTFTIDGTDIAIDIPAWTSRRIDLDLPAGTYQVVCTMPGHAMHIDLTITG